MRSRNNLGRFVPIHSKGRQRNATVRIYTFPESKALVQQMAAERGVSVSDLLRKMIARALAEMKVTPPKPWEPKP